MAACAGSKGMGFATAQLTLNAKSSIYTGCFLAPAKKGINHAKEIRTTQLLYRRHTYRIAENAGGIDVAYLTGTSKGGLAFRGLPNYPRIARYALDIAARQIVSVMPLVNRRFWAGSTTPVPQMDRHD